MLLFIILLIILTLFVYKQEWGGGGEKGENWEWRKANKKIDHNIPFAPLYSRIIEPSAPGEKYFARHYREMISIKLGQRKLFFNELELYTFFLERQALKKGIREKKVIVVYAGAAAGIHSTLLAKIFSSFPFDNGKEFHFHYYDMNPFSEDLKKYKNIHLYHQYFTDEDALSFLRSKNEEYVIFLSDIRSGSDEDAVERDMEMQRKWVELMQPDLIMLKFRLRWEPPEKIEYFDGHIYTQPRIGPASTETRLIFEKIPSTKSDSMFKKKIYDTEEYNRQLFYFQRYNRNAFHEIKDFEELKKGIPGLCHCYDCWSEIEIVRKFLKIISLSKIDGENIINFFKKVDAHTKSSLNVPPHNLLANERDINKKITLLEKLAIANVEKITEKATKPPGSRF